jgi:HEAT repeat protein
VQIAAVTALGALGDERAVPHLIPLLDHELLALPAAEALGKIGDPCALEPLTRIASSKDRWLAAAVAEALTAIGKAGSRGTQAA